MSFSKDQTDLISKYLSDLSKILVASVVIGFFIPTSAGPITLPVFLSGTMTALVCLILSVRLAK